MVNNSYDGMRITNIKWKGDNEGYIKIYQEPDGRNTVMMVLE